MKEKERREKKEKRKEREEKRKRRAVFSSMFFRSSCEWWR
jgi:hypothetical protein